MKFIIIVLIFICSCGNTNKIKAQIIDNIGRNKNQSCKIKVFNDEIVRNIFTIDIFRSDITTIKRLFKTSPTVENIKEKGRYDNQEYTTYLLKTQNSWVKLFKNNEGFYIDEALIRANDITLYDNFSIGMLKEDFCKQIYIKNSECDTIIITDEDQTMHINFIFSKNLLKEIVIKPFE